MRVLESRRVLQPVAQRPGAADVHNPNERDRNWSSATSEVAGREENERPDVCVGGVVERRAHAWPGEVAAGAASRLDELVVESDAPVGRQNQELQTGSCNRTVARDHLPREPDGVGDTLGRPGEPER